jgi:hypothetical protein
MRRILLTLTLALATMAMPRAEAYLSVNDLPATVPQTVTLSGAALGSDTVHIWAFPHWPAVDGLWVGAGVPLTTPDLVRQLDTGGWLVLARDLPVGTYPIRISAHDPVTNTFTVEAWRTISVRACVQAAVCWTFYGPSGPVFFFIQQCQ